ncbi:crossover junction endodeoxyribonuclease RuvC [Anaplasma marginale]|uniref:Crossover junction endodeoxyribonuclease RuvC n=2 Tax=Anaplasma marginale TaxID=770 RepID=RUVC_ANAMM|nr:RecName: Full=Crossover junction endodeoxyribonuclease RuvC; AltName: Full=Holliday junction nuclease RuvC; AltName: Full=Holliday junction resolvase RuvC [Anaplasma marginale str. St. Maries]AAV87093.1 holliday (crossover) junction endodeoxyribonuclease [Anaplasma marginale str. St. Maries]
MMIIGIDPGLEFTGWGVVSSTNSQSVCLLDSGVISTRGISRESEKLYKIYVSLLSVLSLYKIDEASIEKVFINSNPRSSMSLCYARAASTISVMSRGIDIYEYSSTAIKKCITGNGMAPKEQVSFMVRSSLGIKQDVEINNHSSDAIAAALCHVYNTRNRNFALK